MFGLSGSRSTSRSTGVSRSNSFSFGQSDSVQGSQSQSLSGGASRSASENQATGRSSQSIAFEDVFSRLFSGAEDTAANLDTSLLTTAANQLFSGGTDFLASLGGDIGSQFLAGQLDRSDGLLDEQLSLLSDDVGSFFNEQVLPGITADAVAGGQLGGGRQGVAQGEAAEAAGDAFTEGALSLRLQNQQRLDAIAAGVADRSNQAAAIGLNGLDSVGNAAGLSLDGQLAGDQFLASILGNRDVLTEQSNQSTGRSASTAEDFARAFSDSFGRSSSRDRAGSNSFSRTDSSSSSRSVGLSFG